MFIIWFKLSLRGYRTEAQSIEGRTCFTDLSLPVYLGDLLRFLNKRKLKDAFCIVGITMIHLYPKES